MTLKTRLDRLTASRLRVVVVLGALPLEPGIYPLPMPEQFDHEDRRAFIGRLAQAEIAAGHAKSGCVIVGLPRAPREHALRT